MTGFCEGGVGHAGCVQCEEFVEWLKDYEALTGALFDCPGMRVGIRIVEAVSSCWTECWSIRYSVVLLYKIILLILM